MSRHRNVRTMNYDEDYEGYDDVYGHSMEDDYSVSPSVSSYMFDRSKTNAMSSFFPGGEDIAEEPDEDDGTTNSAKAVEQARKKLGSISLETAVADLVPEEEILLKSCMDAIHDVVGDSIPDSTIIAQILRFKFNTEKALDAILTGSLVEPVTEVKKMKLQGDVSGPIQKGDRGAPAMTISEGKRPPPKSTAAADAGPRARPVTKPEPSRAAQSKASVTVGFDLPPKERSSDVLSVHSSDSRSSSTVPSPVPPFEEKKEETGSKAVKVKEFKPEAALKEYSKGRSTGKQLINLLVIGHVDAGKSTLMGHLLWQLGQVSKKLMHKFEQESKKIGKQSFVYAWVLDETGEERNRGITMDVGQSKFETATKSVVLLDAPGHKDFIPNMITGASQADVAILVVDSTTGEFETGFESGGQTREHALLVRSLGVNQLMVAVNKLDTVNWSQSRFEEVKIKLTNFLVKNAGFRESDIRFVPCSGLMGDNLTQKSNQTALTCWYQGPTLLEAIDTFKPPERPVGKPLRLTINDVFKGPGGLCIAGRIETGMLQAGDKVLVQPSGEVVTVKSVTMEEELGTIAFAGDPVLVTLQGLTDATVICIGDILSDPNHPCKVTTKFQARLVTFDAMSIPLMKGFTGVMHLGSVSEQIVVKNLISQLHKGTGEVIKAKPRFLGKNSNGLVDLETLKPVCIEEFKDVKELGRFSLRSSGVTVAAGVVTRVT